MKPMSAPAVEVQGLAKHYGPVVALRNVDLSIKAGEYFVLLGPSGGGKTTLLRTIGGFHKPTNGNVLLHGEDVTELPPDKRPTSMVFQSYALFPHMTVMKNVAYGLSLTKMPKDEIHERCKKMLSMVGLDGYSERKPHELSGGQQQRVQLARSLVLDRDILLLDEPLAALDAQLRKDMCLELKHLQEQVGITFIHVTHNQEEAMTVADRIALIANGDVVEHGEARKIYEAPNRRFTASFVGENNVLDGTVRSVEGHEAMIDTGAGLVRVDRNNETVNSDQSVSFSVRSELMKVCPQDSGTPEQTESFLLGTYQERVYLGLTTSHIVKLSNGLEVNVRALSDNKDAQDIQTGTAVRVSWPTQAARFHVN